MAPYDFQGKEPDCQSWPFLQLYCVTSLPVFSHAGLFFRPELDFLLSQQSLPGMLLPAATLLLADPPSSMRPQLRQFFGDDQVSFSAVCFLNVCALPS